MNDDIGQCYEAALYAQDYAMREWALCHGYPISRHPDALGERFGHAWLEIGDLVFDAAAAARGANLAMVPKAIYYRTGHIEPQHVRRYTHREAQEMLAQEENFGPWIDDPYPNVRYANKEVGVEQSQPSR